MLRKTSIVLTESGPVQGFQKTIPKSESTIDCFLGIPYAAPPIGDLRWKSPRPAENWRELRSCFEFGADLPQLNNPLLQAKQQSEDCLYLNVWTPETKSPQKLPVMVWIHGGGFVGGSGSDQRSDGARMAAKGVVVVSINYRAGVFGFLAHPVLTAESELNVSGNYGLQDQIAALKWIQQNISNFGGDPNKVTAFGVSAGSASISLLLTCPQAKGLFHQTILHSPGAARPLATLAEAQEFSVQALGAGISRLRALDDREVLKLTNLFNPKIRGLTTPRILRPILDGVYLRDNERAVFKAQGQIMLPMIVGSNLDEGSALTKAWTIQSKEEYLDLVAANFKSYASEALSIYPVNEAREVSGRVAELFADTQFNYGTRLLAQSNSNQIHATWRYLFSRRRPSQTDGPHHDQEVAHAFGNLSVKTTGVDHDFDDRDEFISDAMLNYWVQFAQTGNPNQSGLPDWPRYQSTADNMIVFGDQISKQEGLRQRNLDFIDRYFESQTTALMKP